MTLGRLLSLALLTASCSSAPASGQGYQGVLGRAVADGVPGIQAYVKRGDSVWEGVAGLSSVETGDPMSPTDRLRLASITKMVTYAATMELVKAGRLRLTDRAVAVTPPGTLDGIPHAGEITVGQLLDHRSGLYNFNGDGAEDFFADLFTDSARGARFRTATSLLAYAKRPEHRPSGRPGEKTAYSSTGYIVLETILEHVTGKPYAEVVRALVFGPLGMRSAGVEGADFGADSIAPSYARPSLADRTGPSPFGGRTAVRRDGLVNLSAGLAQYNGWAHAAGAVAANAGDLARFMDAVAAGKLTVLADQDGELARARARADRYFEWNGGSWGIQATILLEPGRDITVVVLTDGTNAGPGSHDIALDLLRAARKSRPGDGRARD